MPQFNTVIPVHSFVRRMGRTSALLPTHPHNGDLSSNPPAPFWGLTSSGAVVTMLDQCPI